jgi:hypothetical protein
MYTNSKKNSRLFNVNKNVKDKRAGLKICPKDNCLYKNEEVQNGLSKDKTESNQHSITH